MLNRKTITISVIMIMFLLSLSTTAQPNTLGMEYTPSDITPIITEPDDVILEVTDGTHRLRWVWNCTSPCQWTLFVRDLQIGVGKHPATIDRPIHWLNYYIVIDFESDRTYVWTLTTSDGVFVSTVHVVVEENK